MFSILLLGVTIGFGVRQDLPVSRLIHACVDNRLGDVICALNDGAQLDEPDEDGFIVERIREMVDEG